jgi:hypothetical protein
MANANGWGDGASNNNIGWGKGADNAIGWGDIHADSYAGLTDIVGTASFTNTLSTTFDGIDEYVDVGDVTSFSNTSTFTFSGWYKQTALDVASFMLGSYVDANNWIAIYTWSNGINYVAIRKLGATSYTSFDYSTVVTAGQWFHFVAVYDGNLPGNDKVKLYFDGVLVTLSYIGTMPASIGAGVNLTNIGKADNFTQTWNGSIDEVSVFSTSLSQTNITDIYNLGTPTDISAMSGLVSWWRMGDGSTYPTINDEIGSNDGTMTNMSAANFVTDVPT